MPDNIITTATFGQAKDNQEEEPIVVAQRFLNIFRQLHIFSDERKEAFNQMILELPKPILKMVKTLPGGTVFLEYLAELEQERSINHNVVDELIAKPEKAKDGGILKNAVAETQAQPRPAAQGEIINSDNFAKVLANSLAQSNAQIIRELQNNRPNNGRNRDGANNNEPLKLVADETFTQTIAKALADALAVSEEKRQQDNKVITQSFLELQENLNKMVEQNAQLKMISNGEVPAEAISAFQIKNVVDDLVKAQSKLLRETTQSQKEELSSAISVAIKESLKLSTQSLIDSFKRMESNSPAPITYAASSPKNQTNFGNVEEAIKAQGREFSSIISSALRESQQNSAQTIIKTLESLKGSPLATGANTLNVEEIIKMQASLFRDITQAQNREFSNLISSALKESQKQSTQAIIAALGQMQALPAATGGFSSPKVLADNVADNDKFDFAAETNTDADINAFDVLPQIESNDSVIENLPQAEKDSSLLSESIITPEIDYDIKDITFPPEDTEKPEEILPVSKKKKKKKKKNQENNVDTAPDLQPDTPIVSKPLHKSKTIISALPEMPEIEDKPSDTISDWGFSFNDDFLPPEKFDYPEPEQENTSAAEEYADADTGTDIKEGGNSEWEWAYRDESHASQDEEITGTEGEDWEWSYEEVPEDEAVEGVEGQDWEWDYEEVPDETPQEYEFKAPEPPAEDELSIQDIIENSEIILPEHFELLLVGMEDDNFHDPYLENIGNMG